MQANSSLLEWSLTENRSPPYLIISSFDMEDRTLTQPYPKKVVSKDNKERFYISASTVKSLLSASLKSDSAGRSVLGWVHDLQWVGRAFSHQEQRTDVSFCKVLPAR